MSKLRGPLQFSVADANRFREVLASVNYSEAGIADLLVDVSTGAANVSASLCASKGNAPLQTLLRLFLLHTQVEVAVMKRVIDPMELTHWVRMGLVRIEQGLVRPLISIAPYSQLLLVYDYHDPNRWDHDDLGLGRSGHDDIERIGHPESEDFVMGLSPSTVRLANATIRRDNVSTLDLGSGSGIQSLLAARHSQSVTGIDCNPRAISIARFNAHFNQINGLDFQQSDMLRPLTSQRYDLIVSNPPFVIQPEFRSFYRDNGRNADSFCRNLIQNTPSLLQDQGIFQMVFDWAHVKGQDWQQRLAEWCEGSGCDAWVMRWDTKDVAEYTRYWNRGWKQQPAFADVYEHWMGWYAEHGIEAISSGMLTMRRECSRATWFRADDAPANFTAPIGEDVLQLFESSGWLQASDQQLLDTCFKLHPAVCLDQRLQHAGGSWIIESASLRRRAGLPYQGEVDALTASLLPQCNGKQKFADLLNALASRNRKTFAEITPVYLGVLRRLLRRGFLVADVHPQPSAAGEPLSSGVGFSSASTVDVAPYADQPELCC
ncbi:MAG: methyltransferase [Rubripirellula sp.]|nr:methyltransferase [Rubripirellula sp.]